MYVIQILWSLRVLFKLWKGEKSEEQFNFHNICWNRRIYDKMFTFKRYRTEEKKAYMCSSLLRPLVC